MRNIPRLRISPALNRFTNKAINNSSLEWKSIKIECNSYKISNKRIRMQYNKVSIEIKIRRWDKSKWKLLPIPSQRSSKYGRYEWWWN
jgi:hypothetical protein